MEYVVLDMEWNQPFCRELLRTKHGISLYGEIIQFGAIKLNDKMRIVDTFNVAVKPRCYKKLHRIVRKITGFSDELMKNGMKFEAAVESFRLWCGEDCAVITWGNEDRPMLDSNLTFFGLDSSWIPPWYNLQWIFNGQTGNEGKQFSLEAATDFFKIERSKELHDAYNDAYYTALVAQKLKLKKGIKHYVDDPDFVEPTDILNIPQKQRKSVSELLNDRKIVTTRCPKCDCEMKILEKYKQSNEWGFAAAKCEKHGNFVVRIKKPNNMSSDISVEKYIYKVGFRNRKYFDGKLEHMRDKQKKANQFFEKKKKERMLERMSV